MDYYSGGYNRRKNGPGTGQSRRPEHSFSSASVAPLSLPNNYIDEAEELMRKEYRAITTSKLRRLFSLVSEVYNEEILNVQSDSLTPESIAAIGMMRVRFAYECGRDGKVKNFVKEAKLMEYLKGIGSSRKAFLNFARYMEALVAYHKYFGGREN